METYLRVLSDADRDRVHEKTIKILAETGVRVETDLGRDYLKKAGAEVDENTRIVRIPRKLLEESLQAAPKEAGCPPSRFAGSVSCLQATTFAVLNKLSISSTSSAACNFNLFQAKAQTLTEAHCNFLCIARECGVPS